MDARYWGVCGTRIRCTLCPRACLIGEGQRGLCFVRATIGGRLRLTTYGRSSGFCVDPIEKKPLSHFLPGTPILSFGSAGCNLTCVFCQNWDLSRAREVERLNQVAAPEQIVHAAARLGCRAVAFTYNDPVPMLEYVVDVAQVCRERQIKAVAVTAGYISSAARPEFFRHIDAANVDLKAFNDGFYRKMASARLAPVLDTLVWLKRETSVWVEITTLLIPGLNDHPDEIKALAAWVVTALGPDVPLHLSAFHPAHRLSHLPPTPPHTVRQARVLAKAEGLRHVYTGNIHDPAAETTSCPGCNAPLIGRDRYRITLWTLGPDANCPQCGRVLEGVFEPVPGDWGAQRHPVTLL